MCWWECRWKLNLVQSCWQYSIVQSLWKTPWPVLTKLELKLPHDPGIPLLGVYSKGRKAEVWRDVFTARFTAARCTTAHRWEDPKCPVTDDCINSMWCVHHLEYCSDWKHKGNFGTGYSMDEPWGHHAKWNKPDTKGQTLTLIYKRYPGSESLSAVSDSETPWPEFSRPEYWSGQPFPSPGEMPNPGSNPHQPHCRGILY